MRADRLYLFDQHGYFFLRVQHTHRDYLAAVQMMTSEIYGMPLTPAALADEKGHVVTVEGPASGARLEALLRPVCTALGCSAGLATAPLTGVHILPFMPTVSSFVHQHC